MGPNLVRHGALPVLEEPTETEGSEFQHGLQHKGGGEEVITVLEGRLQRLGEKEKEEFRRGNVSALFLQ